MVAAHDGAQVLASPFDAFVRRSSIADQIATAEDLVIIALGMAQDGLKGVKIGMDVAE